MKNVYFTVGPSQLFPGVESFLNQVLKEEIPSLFHRSPRGQEIYKSTVDNLKKLLKVPSSYQVFFLSSGSEGMESCIKNCVKKYSFNFINGYFSKRWYEMAEQLRKKPQKFEVEWGRGFDFDSILVPKNIELLCFTQNETSTGVALNSKDIDKFKKRYPDKLIAVDIVSSAPYTDLNYKFIDLAFFSVQKGFGLPAGLGVIIVSPQALKKAKYLKDRKFNTGTYHNFENLLEYGKKNQTYETPNLLNIYLLNKVVEKMLKTGIDKIRKQTEEKMELLYNFFDTHKKYKPFVEDQSLRSKTVVVAEVSGGSESVIKKLAAKGIVIGSGHGILRERQIRIANFPAHSKKDICRLLSCLNEIN